MRGWPHAPSRAVQGPGTYFITAGTYEKEHIFRDPADLDFLHDHVLSIAEKQGWLLAAWAFFSNHYHLVGRAPETENPVFLFQKACHGAVGVEMNRRHQTPGRKVMFSYRQTLLTYEKSYLARLNYVIRNPVKHGLTQDPRTYRWCSAKWFEDNADRAWFETVSSFPIDRVNVEDDF